MTVKPEEQVVARAEAWWEPPGVELGEDLRAEHEQVHQDRDPEDPSEEIDRTGRDVEGPREALDAMRRSTMTNAGPVMNAETMKRGARRGVPERSSSQPCVEERRHACGWRSPIRWRGRRRVGTSACAGAGRGTSCRRGTRRCGGSGAGTVEDDHVPAEHRDRPVESPNPGRTVPHPGSGRPMSTTMNPTHTTIAAMASSSPMITTSCISSSS